ncbi:Lymphocyte antigen 6E [Aquarana catesbeiana]|uniref:Lymphocyte antigen 6E n=1 Tax=Aquarana catesbeiana TaxID=8400 RepID=A0A2G9RB63_AQUCT|nr:Lymphocyte antigen 6E [Aquarana catesbeiana]
MAAQASILLLAALCIGTAYSLQCYTCVSATSNSNCMTPTTCLSTEGYCETSVGTATLLGVTATSITKSCAASCTASSGSVLGVGSGSTSCCTTDLCNTSGANSIKSSYSIIVLVVGTLVMVIGSSLL